MKKIHSAMIVGLMASVVMLAGCKREYGTVTLGANIDNGRDAKVYIDNLTPCWHNNDLIRVNNQTCTTSAALGSSAQITDVVESSHYRAIYPADIVGDVDISSSSTIAVTLPHEQTYEVDSRGDQKVKVPMGAYSSNESLTFHNLCPLIKVVISNRMDNDFALGRITVAAATSYLSGLCSASVTGSPNDHIGTMVPSSASHDVSLVFPAANRPTIGRGDRDTYIYYIVAPEFGGDEGEHVTITLYSANGQYATFEKPGVSLRHNRMATVSLTVEEWTFEAPVNPYSLNGAMPGLFSVSATQQVHFSQGNLQYQASTNTWCFAEHQYDYVGTQIADDYGCYGGNVSGSDNRNISSTYSGWIDLFGWGTGNNPTLAFTDYTYYSTFVDWGSNAIINGGNAVNQWRTLTHSEWSHLLNSRTNASSKRGTGNINGVHGLIILPDSWTLPSGCPQFNPGFASGWSRNSYTLAQWAQMESAGAVFLPAAGYRYGTDVLNVGNDGDYWSSTPNYEYDARYMYFYSSSHSSITSDRNNGFSVRLVQD